MGISELADDHRQRLAELDVNPILAREDGILTVDALAVMGAGDNLP